MENIKKERKIKYIGFRIGVGDYLRMRKLCEQRNTTITDFTLSAIYQMLDKSLADIKQEKNPEESLPEAFSLLKKEMKEMKENFSQLKKLIENHSSDNGLPDLITFKEGLKIIPFTRLTVRSKIFLGKIPYRKLGGKVMFSRIELKEWLNRATKKSVTVIPVE